MPRRNVKAILSVTAENLFLKHGFQRVTVDEICRKAGVSRKTFYVYYVNKSDILTQVLERVFGDFLSEFYAIMNANTTFSSKMKKIIQLKIAFGKKMSSDFLTEVYSGSNREVKAYFQHLVEVNQTYVSNYYKEAQARGDIREGLDTNALVFLLNYWLELARNKEFISFFPNSNFMMKQLKEMIMYGICTPEEN